MKDNDICPPLCQGFIQVGPHSDSLSDTSGGIDVDMTESASEDFESGDVLALSSSNQEEGSSPSQDDWRADFSEQVMRYTQHKPKKTKDVTSRE